MAFVVKPLRFAGHKPRKNQPRQFTCVRRKAFAKTGTFLDFQMWLVPANVGDCESN